MSRRETLEKYAHKICLLFLHVETPKRISIFLHRCPHHFGTIHQHSCAKWMTFIVFQSNYLKTLLAEGSLQSIRAQHLCCYIYFCARTDFPVYILMFSSRSFFSRSRETSPRAQNKFASLFVGNDCVSDVLALSRD